MLDLPAPPRPTSPCARAGLWAAVAQAAPNGGQRDLLLGLQAEAGRFAGAVFATSTARTYGRYQRYYVVFMYRAGLRAFVFDGVEAHLILYVTSLTRTCKYSSVCCYLQGVKQFFLDAGLLDPLRADRRPPLVGFWRVMAGIERLHSGVVLRKQPIERWMLLRFQQQLQLWGDLSTNTQHLAVLTAMMVAWLGMYRISNIGVVSAAVLPSDLHMLRRADVRVDFGNYCLWSSTRWSKTNQRAGRVHTVAIAGLRGSPIDPVGLYCALLARVPAVEGGQHAFSYIGGRGRVVSLTKAVFGDFTKLLATAIGLPTEGFSGRSFRRGGATAAFAKGVAGEMIQYTGDWKSPVYRVYVDVLPAQQLVASQSMIADT